MGYCIRLRSEGQKEQFDTVGMAISYPEVLEQVAGLIGVLMSQDNWFSKPHLQSENTFFWVLSRYLEKGKIDKALAHWNKNMPNKTILIEPAPKIEPFNLAALTDLALKRYGPEPPSMVNDIDLL